MWSALKSDLEEFVTTVKDESSTVLAASNALSNQERGSSGNHDVAVDPQDDVGGGIMVGEGGDVMYEDGSSSSDDAGVIMEEVDRLVRQEETFTEPLDVQNQDVVDFLKDFSVEKQTDDISKLLEEYPETLQVQFESLVPTQISYKEFWERYYFRCDEERIRREWDLQEEAARKAREEAIANTVRGVKNLFGGAVKAVSSTLQAADDGVDAVTTASPFESTPPPPTTGAQHQGLFGASGRPPFVMNTAVDEDDEEEEEELGWDDDDDDEEDFDEEEELIQGQGEEITFSGGKNEEIEKLTEQLTQAMEERDQLHNTVEMQSQEIAKLRSGFASGSPANADDSDVEKLRMELFEKDSELAALKASLEDTQDDSKEGATKKDAAKIASQERELEQLRSTLAVKETDISALKEELELSSAKLEKALADGYGADDTNLLEIALLSEDLETKEDEIAQLSEQLEKSSAQVERLLAESDDDKAARSAAVAQGKELKEEVKRLREKLEASQSEAEMLRQTVETVSSGTEAQVASAQEEAAEAIAQVDSLTAQVEDLKGNLHFTSGRADHLERELQDAKDALKKQEAAAAAKLAEEIAKVNADHEQLSSGTQNSDSTGVKVAAPKEDAAPATVTKIESSNDDDDDDDDDWGDDWGDEDE